MLCMGFHPPLDGALGLADERTHERADVQEQGRSTSLGTERLGTG